jgi:hypothetical protein
MTSGATGVGLRSERVDSCPGTPRLPRSACPCGALDRRLPATTAGTPPRQSR